MYLLNCDERTYQVFFWYLIIGKFGHFLRYDDDEI